MRKKYICVCTPTLGVVSIEWAQALRDLMFPLNTCYMNVFVKDDVGGEIAEARNRAVKQALSYENEHREVTKIFWLDDDVIVPRTALLALNNYDRDIVSGVYFTRFDPSEPLIFPSRGGGVDKFIPDRIYEVWGHGMGLTLIKTDVYKRMRDELRLPLDKYGSPEWNKTTGADDVEIEDDTLFVGGTEDLYFLHKAGQMGYKPLVDTSRHCFGWHYDSRLKRGYPLKQWGQRSRGEPIVWDVPGGEVVWG